MLKPLWIVTLVLLLCAACGTQRGDVAERENRPLMAEKTLAHPLHQNVQLTDEQQLRFNELFTEAICRKQQDEVDAEYELLQAALDINPLAPEALYELGVLQLSFTSYSDSIAKAQGDSLLRLAVRRAPDNFYYKETLANYEANRADYREAIRLYEEIADEKPSYETLVTLMWLYKTNGDYPGAIRTIERLEKKEGRSEALSMEKFQTYLAMNDNEHAYRAIEDLCAEYPLDLRYRVLLGDLYDQNGYHERALDIYRDVLASEPDNSYAQLSLLAYYKAARADSLYLDLLHRVVLNPHTQQAAREEAMRAYMVDNINAGADSLPVLQLFDQLLADPGVDAEMVRLKTAYLLKRNMPMDSVMKGFYRVLELEPSDTQSRLQLLKYYLEKEDMQQVAKVCHDGILYDPSELTFYFYRALAYQAQGRKVEAVKVLQEGTDRITDDTDPEIASGAWTLMGDLLHDDKLREEAYMAYDKALTYNPTNLLCLNNYAYLLTLDGKRLQKAEEMSKRTIEAEGTNATYLDTYAWVLYQLKQYDLARIYINEAINYLNRIPTTNRASIYEHAGDIYYACARRSEAVSYWRKALSLASTRLDKSRLQRKVYRR